MQTRIRTGIKGFDRLVEGGFPKGFTVLVTGTPGTGKTLFSIEYLYHGAKSCNEKGMFITLEQSLDDIRGQAKKVGFDLPSLEKSGMLTLMHIPASSLHAQTIDDIKKELEKRKIKRVVIDSLSTLAINAPVYTPIKDITLRDIMNYKAFFSPPVLGDFVVKRFIYGFLDDLKKAGVTSIVTSEAPEKGHYLSRDTISEFLADGIIQMTFESMGGEYSRSLIVRKMRGTKNNDDVHPVEISKDGIVVHDVK